MIVMRIIVRIISQDALIYANSYVLGETTFLAEKVAVPC